AASVAGLHYVLRPGGRCFMLGLSDQQAGEWGPVHKLTQNAIRDAFTGGWHVDSIEASTIDITTDPDGARAWLATLTRAGAPTNRRGPPCAPPKPTSRPAARAAISSSSASMPATWARSAATPAPPATGATPSTAPRCGTPNGPTPAGSSAPAGASARCAPPRAR